MQLASQTAGGIKGDAISERPSISADGHKVAFVSAADNLDADDPDGYPDVYVKDLQTGDLTLASRTTDGTKADTGGVSATLSADGSTVAFSSTATNLSGRRRLGGSHVYVKTPRHGRAHAGGRRHDRPARRAVRSRLAVVVRRWPGCRLHHRCC